MVLPAFFYIGWDLWFTHLGIWSFTPEYITGFKLYNLPIEEVLFFFIVPYCCVFIYECIRCYFPGIQQLKLADKILQAIAVLLFLLSFVFYNKHYTFYTFLFNGFFILLIFVFRKFFSGFNTAAFLVSYLIILIPFLIVNGFLTAIPVVNYNDHENLGIRLYTIPVEDIFYGMLLILMNVVGFDYRKSISNL